MLEWLENVFIVKLCTWPKRKYRSFDIYSMRTSSGAYLAEVSLLYALSRIYSHLYIVKEQLQSARKFYLHITETASQQMRKSHY